MTYSYTQISHYLGCPRRYRHRYLDGWREKEIRAAMVFGRVFEKALAAYFRREDPTATLFKEWAAYQEVPLEYASSDSWERMYRQGVTLLERLAQDDRVRIRQPRRNLQIKLTRPLSNGSDFLAYIDAIGHLDGTRRLIEWKTTTSRYPEEPEGLLALDPQLLCYSWVSGPCRQSLWHRTVLGRGAWELLRHDRSLPRDEEARGYNRLRQRPAPAPGPSLPADPAIRARPPPGQTLRR